MHGNFSEPRRRRWAASLALALLLPAASDRASAAGEPQLRRVTVSTGGVALFDFVVQPAADGTVRLIVPLRQVDDILKSLVVYDARGVIQGVTLPGGTPQADLFRDAPVAEEALESLPALLDSLLGTKLGVLGPTRLQGRVLSVTPEEVKGPEGQVTVRHRVGLLTADGLRSFVLEEAQGLEFADDQLRARLERLLDGLAMARREQQRELVLSVRSAVGPVGLGYLAEVPLWKATYRLVADDSEALLQGWAVLENTSGHDWRDVELTLAAGSPRALRQALYRSYYVDRPEVPVVAAGKGDEIASAPPTRAGARAVPEAAIVAEAAVPGFEQAASLPPLALAASEELAAQTLYRLPERVLVDAGQSLMAPLVDQRVTVQRVALLTSEQGGTRPRAALRFTNRAGTSLPPGLVTVYERGGDGALSFAGDASLPATPPGADRVLPYAADIKLEVRAAQSRPRRLASARVADGVLELVVAERAVTTLEIALEDDTPRQLVVDWERAGDQRVIEPPDVTLTPGRVRFERPIPGRARMTERLVLERDLLRRFELADADPGEIVAAAGAEGVTGPLAAVLGRLRELAAAAADAVSEVERLAVERGQLATDQERLRANLQSVPKDSDLAQRYLERLADSEARIEALDRSRAEVRERRERALSDRRDFVRQLRL